MRTDHNTLADLITTANAGQSERADMSPGARVWWPMIVRVAACAGSAYMALAALAVAADYLDLFGP